MRAFGLSLPAAAIIGLIGEEDSGIPAELRAVGPEVTVVDYEFDRHDPLVRLRMRRDLIEARRGGARVLIASWDEALLKDVCDEVWWIDRGQVIHQGDPRETLALWNAHVAQRWRSEQASVAPIRPSLRRGDGRALVEAVELLDAAAQPVLGFMSGEEATVRVAVAFHAEVDAPVIGMLIRTRVGVDVYGTNTELEALSLGPRRAGDRVHVAFRFRCELCPGDYTLTVASHDPDGTWHEWLEDAIAFSVGDSRYTAGVANLRAAVTWELY